MLVEDYMTRDVESVPPETTLKRAAERMRVCNVGILPVIERDGTVVGAVTDRDIVVRAVNRGLDPSKTRVLEVMTKHPACCHGGQELRSAAKTMENHRVHRLPVLDRREKMIGILSLTDFTKDGEGREILARVLGAVAAQHV